MKTKNKIKLCLKCEKPVDRHGNYCRSCYVEMVYKRRIRGTREESKIRGELRTMKKEIKQKLHDKLLKEILEEESIKL